MEQKQGQSTQGVQKNANAIRHFFKVIFIGVYLLWPFQVAQWIKNIPATQEMQDTQFQSLGREATLEEGMITHSSILAWKIPWTEEAGELHTVHKVAKNHT